jgi:hypothetical protein
VVVSVRWIEDEVTADDEHSLHCADQQLPLARRTRTRLAETYFTARNRYRFRLKK